MWNHGNMIQRMRSFLPNRKTRIRIVYLRCKKLLLCQGVPQEESFPQHYSFCTSTIKKKNLPNLVHAALYADDFRDMVHQRIHIYCKVHIEAIYPLSDIMEREIHCNNKPWSIFKYYLSARETQHLACCQGEEILLIYQGIIFDWY